MNKNIVFFDGVCNLCNGFVQFLIRFDRKDKLKFSSLQSDYAQKYLRQENIEQLNSIVFKSDDALYTQSSAAIKIMIKVNKLFLFMYLFYIIPKPIRDAVYRYIAKNRYKWFGKKESCWLPTPELQSKFL